MTITLIPQIHVIIADQFTKCFILFGDIITSQKINKNDLLTHIVIQV